ncbi:immediate early response gene 5-like protein [Genypterus blacodes]|uniref:immediate early response gene 5-like protein n=1 Tax=Genypterus blacodes TaxID=154954 RepID=UPI003F75D9FD
MSHIMELTVDAQNLISISLLKIHNSRLQRGGIKLHKNLLVSSVLRNARQVYIKEIYRMQQYEEVMTVCNEIQQLNPLDLDAEDCDEEEELMRDAGCGALADPFGSPPPPPPPLCLLTVSALPGEDADKEPCYYRSCCMEGPSVFPPTNNCNKTTVLDLDTHVVTTVENLYLHQDCVCDAPECGQLGAQSPDRKRRMDSCCCWTDQDQDFLDFTSTRKRAKREDCSFPNTECPDTSNISTLISILGSGFSELLSRQEQICSRPALSGLGAWTRAIIAY